MLADVGHSAVRSGIGAIYAICSLIGNGSGFNYCTWSTGRGFVFLAAALAALRSCVGRIVIVIVCISLPPVSPS